MQMTDKFVALVKIRSIDNKERKKKKFVRWFSFSLY